MHQVLKGDDIERGETGVAKRIFVHIQSAYNTGRCIQRQELTRATHVNAIGESGRSGSGRKESTERLASRRITGDEFGKVRRNPI